MEGAQVDEVTAGMLKLGEAESRLEPLVRCCRKSDPKALKVSALYFVKEQNHGAIQV